MAVGGRKINNEMHSVERKLTMKMRIEKFIERMEPG